MEVTIDHVKFSYIQGSPVLGDISIKANEGSFVCLLGQSGCGKSTLLRLIAGLEKPDEGILEVDGKPIASAGLDRGVVFQDYGLFPWMTAGENIMIALKQRFPELSADERKSKALFWMQKVGMNEALFKKLPGELSGGQKQRCGIARAFAIDPPILLMDEPFASLDAVTKAKLQDLVLELWQQEENKKKTIFFVTHEVDEALVLATDICVFSQAPSVIMHKHSFKDEIRPTRQNIYTNKEIQDLRNMLIKILYEDAVTRVGATSNK
ncbi:MAG: ABC transporter ATP-binding protein [Tissierellia bacterium]|nr:ABC transporter ATP-binding protein [Tissierellia bacterium]